MENTVTPKQNKAANPRPKTIDLNALLVDKLKAENADLKAKLMAASADISKPGVESHPTETDKARDPKIERQSSKKSLRPVISSWLKENRNTIIILAIAATLMTKAFSEVYHE